MQVAVEGSSQFPEGQSAASPSAVIYNSNISLPPILGPSFPFISTFTFTADPSLVRHIAAELARTYELPAHANAALLPPPI